MGVILWELVKGERVGTWLGRKAEAEVRGEVGQEGFWTRALAALPPPHLPESGGFLVDVLSSCLSHEPDKRPDLKILRLRLRPLHKGMRSNILDSMIGLLEKHAGNLERLVDERTAALSEEKRKTEELLYELIPAAVAVELKEGLRVPAQTFTSVSVYFSDIVGFTAISAQSTALQVYIASPHFCGRNPGIGISKLHFYEFVGKISERTWPGGNEIRRAGDILMFSTLGLFLTRNRMETGLDPKKCHLGVILGVKGHYGQKYVGSCRIAPCLKACDTGNFPKIK